MDKEYWERIYRNSQTGQENEWMRKYLAELPKGASVLEIGCGLGELAREMSALGFQVTATDYSVEAIRWCKSEKSDAVWVLHDTREAFPFENEAFDAAVASLSLHYFAEEEMRGIVSEIDRVLKPGGRFVFRLNAASDEESKKERPIFRRYFSAEDCRRLFSRWREKSLFEKEIVYFGKPKTLMEGAFEKLFQPSARFPIQ